MNKKMVLVIAAALAVVAGCRYVSEGGRESVGGCKAPKHGVIRFGVMEPGDDDRRRYIEFVRNVALVPKPEMSPECWYDAIPDDDLWPFDEPTRRTYEKHYKIVYAERQYLSFYCEEFFHDGGVYIPWPEYTVGTVDRRTGKIVTLDDIDAFADRYLLRQRLKDAVSEKMEDDDVASRAFPHNNFYLAEDGWHFVYNAGEIAGLSTGPIEVVIERSRKE